MSNSTLRTCPKGHRYRKTSDCPTCPICENERKPQSGFLANLSAPALRALKGAGIDTVAKLAQYSEKELLQLHGFGKSALSRLRHELEKMGLSFRE